MEDLKQRLRRIRAALEEACPERLADLRAIEELCERTGLVAVDCDGSVVQCSPLAKLEWGMEAGAPVWAPFEGGEARALQALVATGWVGVGERLFRTSDGRGALLRCRKNTTPAQLEILDVTRLAAVSAEAARHGEREALAGFAAAVAAELANPVNVVEGRLELALAVGDEKSPVGRQIAVALQQARDISGSVRALRLVGHSALTTAVKTPIAHVVDGAWSAAAPRLRGAELELDLEDGLLVGAELGPLSRAVAHLLVVLADQPRRTLIVSARPGPDGAVLALARRGALGGADPLEGRGFAQSVARGLIAGLGGDVRSFVEGEQVRIEIRLPHPSGSRVRARRGTEVVLVVGRPALIDVLAPMLEPEGFTLEWASAGEEALARLQAESFSGVVADLLLDGCSGLAVALAQAERNGPPCVVLAGAPVAALPPGVTAMVPPIARADLLRALGRRVRG